MIFWVQNTFKCLKHTLVGIAIECEKKKSADFSQNHHKTALWTIRVLAGVPTTVLRRSLIFGLFHYFALTHVKLPLLPTSAYTRAYNVHMVWCHDARRPPLRARNECA